MDGIIGNPSGAFGSGDPKVGEIRAGVGAPPGGAGPPLFILQLSPSSSPLSFCVQFLLFSFLRS